MAPVIIQLLESVRLTTRDGTASIPQAPSATDSHALSSNDGWSPSAIIGIVAAIILILAMVPLIAFILRRNEKKGCVEMVSKDCPSLRLESSHSSTMEESNLKNIMVTREVQRSSLRVASELKRPEQVYTHQRGWSHIEVRGGNGH
jgi:hypothetical protein